MQDQNFDTRQKKSAQAGSVFTVLLAGIAMASALSLVLYQTISGPMSSMVRVTNKTATKTQMQSVSSIMIMDAVNQTGNGDCDADGSIEPREWRVGTTGPTGGGLVPLTIGAPVTDPWGTDYGYCVWDVGAAIKTVNACSADNVAANAKRLNGNPTPTVGNALSQTVIAVISAGPNRQFQTTCRAYANNTVPADANTDNIVTTGDDLVMRYTYKEAAAATNGLWTIKVGDTAKAVIGKDLEIGPAAALGTVPTDVSTTYNAGGIINAAAVVTKGAVISGGAVRLANNTAVTSCLAGNAGDIRYNTTSKSVEVCDGAGNWVAAGGTLPISSLSAGTKVNSIDSASWAQTWTWNTLANANALTLSSASTTAAGNGQTLLNIAMSGANATSTQTTYGQKISNTHTGTSSTNVGLYVTASGGTNNYAAIFDEGRVGVGGTPGRAQFTVTIPDALIAADWGTPGVTETGMTLASGQDFMGMTMYDRDGSLASVNDRDSVLYWGDNNDDNLRFIHLSVDSGAPGTYPIRERMRITASGEVGVGTVSPNSLLHVGIGGYAQFGKNFAGAPTAADCDNAVEVGRMTYDTTNHRWYVCTSAAGWVYGGMGTSGGTVALSALTAATATNSINNATYAQTWSWDTLAGANALTLSTNSTTAAGNAQTLLNIAASGANATSTQTTYGQKISNTHTGTSSTNVGLYATASGATNNYAAIFANGSVGIGTSAPSSLVKLHVLSTGGGGVAIEDTTNPFLHIRRDGSNEWFMTATTTGTNNLEFRTGNISSVAKMALTTSGRLGIGTTAPEAIFHVQIDGASGSAAILERAQTTTNPVQLFLRKANGTPSAPTTVAAGDSIGQIGFDAYETTTGYSLSNEASDAAIRAYLDPAAVPAAGNMPTNLSFRTKDVSQADAAPRMTILYNGNVGIGTVAPTSLLHVYGNVGRYTTVDDVGRILLQSNDNSTNPALTLRNTFDGGYGVGINFSLGYGGAVGTLGTALTAARINALEEQTWTSTASTQDAALSFQTALDGSASERMRINSAGNVGIGTTAPVAKLDAVGSVIARGYGGTNGMAVIRANGTEASPTGLATNDQIGAYGFQGYKTGAGYTQSALIAGYAAENYSSATTYGSYLTFETSSISPASARAERMRIDSAGNLGLGTTSPQSLLQVASTGYAQFSKNFAGAPTAADCDNALEVGRMTYDTTNHRWYVCTSAAGWVYAGMSASGSTVALSALTAATATNSINNASYAQTWAWDTLAGASALTLSTNSTTAAGNAQTVLHVAASGANATTTQTTYGQKIFNTHTGTLATNVGLYASASGGTNNYAAIFGSGRVGIGTSAPTGILDVLISPSRYLSMDDSSGRVTLNLNDNVNVGALTLSNAYDGGYGVGLVFALGYGGNSGVTAGTTVAAGNIFMRPDQAWTSTASTQDSYMSFATALDGTGSEKMRLTSGGLLGIGTTAPTYYLDVQGLSSAGATANARIKSNGTGDSDAYLTIDAAATGEAALYLRTAGQTSGDSIIYRLDGAKELAFATDDTRRMTIDAVGNVGVGIQVPTSKLHIAGSVSGPAWTTTGKALSVDAATYTDTTSSGALNTSIVNFESPTFASTNPTTANITNVRIAAPAAGANVTAGNLVALGVSGNTFLSSGDTTLSNGNTSDFSGLLTLTGNRSITYNWTTQGGMLTVKASTLTDTGAAGTKPNRNATAFYQPTFASTNATTATTAATVYIADAPAAGANTTITTPLALYVASGTSSFAGNVGIGTTTPQSLLQVGSGGYAQFSKNFAGAPTAADCDNALEVGRMTYDTTNNRWYVCTSASGWVYSGMGTSGTPVSISALTAATATNSINNATYAQTWSWDTLAGANALTLSTNSTTAAGDAQTLLNLALSGANATAGQDTYGMKVSNTHTGATSRNIGLYVTTSGGTNNYAAIFNGGYIGIGTTSPSAALHFAGNITAPAWSTNGIVLRQDAATFTDTTSSGAVSNIAINSLEGGTIAASSPATWANAATLRIGGAPIAGANATITRSYALIVTGDSRFNGRASFGSGFDPSSIIAIAGDESFPSWSTDGANVTVKANTLTDTTGSGTIGNRVSSSFAVPTFASTAATTLTNASNVYIAGAPLAGTNTTITNPLSLYVAGGVSSFTGNVGIGTVTPGEKLEVYQGNLYMNSNQGGVASPDLTRGVLEFNNRYDDTGNPTANKINFYEQAGVSRYGIGVSSASLDLFAGGGGAFNFYTGHIDETTPGTSRLTILSTGNTGIGATTPQSLLQVGSGGYAQFSKNFAGAPTAADCDNALEVGRMTYDTTNNRWYVCTSASGWVYSGMGTSGTTISISALTAAAATNSINNLNYAQTWAWNTLTTENALTLSSSSLTTGTLLNVTNSNTNTSAMIFNVTGGDASINGHRLGMGGGASSTNVAFGGLGANTSGLRNTAIGNGAMATNTSGTGNSAVGKSALAGNTTGGNNTAMGKDALVANTTASSNTAIGSEVMQNSTIGSFNTAIGESALKTNVANAESTAVGYLAMRYANSDATGITTYNTALGAHALRGSVTPANNTGIYNTAIGHTSLYVNTSGSYNAALGANALQSNTTGGYNTAVGRLSMNSNNIGSHNTGLGYGALQSNVGGGQSTAVGYQAMYYANSVAAATITYNTAIGFQAMMGSNTPANNTGTQNTMVGYDAMAGMTTGSNNAGLGMRALYSNTTGNYNTAVGRAALFSNVTKSESTAVGYAAMQYADSAAGGAVTYNTALGAYALQGSATAANNTGTDNTALGHNTLNANTSGTDNIAIGVRAMNDNTTGTKNTAIGNGALYTNLARSDSTAVGYNAMYYASTGGVPSYNTALGGYALRGSTAAGSNSGLKNTALGHSSMFSNTTGGTNTGVGYQSLYTNADGDANASVGALALYANTSGSYNTAVGYSALTANTTGSNNTALGGNALAASTTANNNVAIGYQASFSSTTAWQNVAIGSSAMYTNVAKSENTAVGFQAMYYTDSGAAATTYNTAVGHSALKGSNTAANNTGTLNVAIGHSAMLGNTTGKENVAVGVAALLTNTTGEFNTAVGREAMRFNTTGIRNTAVGVQNLQNNTVGSYNTAIGLNALVYNVAMSESTALGYQAMEHANNTAVAGVSYNTAVGTQALQGSNTPANNTGLRNTAVGHSALKINTSGSNNVAVGQDAMRYNATGNYNTTIGTNSMNGCSSCTNSGSYNTALGYTALNNIDTGSYNVAVGSGALTGPNIVGVSGSQNTAVGYTSMNAMNGGNYNTAMGSQSLYSQTTGDGSIAIGYRALRDSTVADGNTAIGYNSMNSTVAVGMNTAVGYQSMYYSNSSAVVASTYNTALGYRALMGSTTPANNTGVRNTAIGAETLVSNTTGGYNNALGRATLYYNTTGSYNVAVGNTAMYDNTTGGYNVAVGHEALFNSTTTSFNIAIGYRALYDTVADTGNVAVGANAGRYVNGALNNTIIGHYAWLGSSTTPGTGNHNTILGYYAASSLESGGANVIIGSAAGNALTSGSNNIAVGRLAMRYQLSGGDNVSIGYNSLAGTSTATSTAANNVAIGTSALSLNDTGNHNVAIGTSSGSQQINVTGNTGVGSQTLRYNTSGTYNTAVGYSALNGLSTGTNTGSYNTAVGYSSLPNNDTGSNNVAMGYLSMGSSTAVGNSVAIGYASMRYNATGINNTAVGFNTLNGVSTGTNSASYNTAVGTNTLSNADTASYNTAIGNQALYVQQTGDNNTALGYRALYALNGGTNNVAIGSTAMNSNVAKSDNVAVGHNAMFYADSGAAASTQNTAVGTSALRGSTTAANNTGTGNTAIGFDTLKVNTSGTQNTAVGQNAGSTGTGNTTGSQNTFIGAGAQANAGTYSNATALGYNATITASNSVRIGNSSVTSIGGYAVWTNVSDRRLKKDIKDSDLGLDFIQKLHPVSYLMKNDKTGRINYGFVAQEVKEALGDRNTTMVQVDNDEMKTNRMAMTDIIAPVVKAIQQLAEMFSKLEKAVADIIADLNPLKKQVADLTVKVDAQQKAIDELREELHALKKARK